MKHIIPIIIGLYQKLFSPVLHSLGLKGGCRFYPSCSQYGNQAIKKYGLLKGSIKGLKRIIRCQPFNKGGYDPC